MAKDIETMRRRAARIQSETDNAVTESMREHILLSGLLDLVKFGEIRIVVGDNQVKQIYVTQTIQFKLTTPTLTVA